MSDAALSARQLLAAAVGAPAESLADGASVGTLAAWDSLAHVRLMMGLEEAMGRKLSSDEIVSVRSLGDVAALLGKAAA